MHNLIMLNVHELILGYSALTDNLNSKAPKIVAKKQETQYPYTSTHIIITVLIFV